MNNSKNTDTKPGKRGANLTTVRKATQFSASNQPQKRGRPKKLQTQIKELFRNPDLTNGERRQLEKSEPLLECFLAKDTWLEIWMKMIELNEDEIAKIVEDKEYPLGFRIIAKAVKADLDNSEMSNMLTVFTRKYGLPHQPNVGVTVNLNKVDVHNSNVTLEEATRFYENILRDGL